MSRYNVHLKTRLQKGLSGPEFDCDLVYEFRKIVGKPDFLCNLKRLSLSTKRLITAWIFCGKLVVNPIMVDSFASLIYYMAVGRFSNYDDSLFNLFQMIVA